MTERPQPLPAADSRVVVMAREIAVVMPRRNDGVPVRMTDDQFKAVADQLEKSSGFHSIRETPHRLYAARFVGTKSETACIKDVKKAVRQAGYLQ